MPTIQIQTQPSDIRVREYATATFTAVLSGSADDGSSSLSASVQWYLSSSNEAVAGATDLTLTLTNVQLAQSGEQYFLQAHSASAAGTQVTSSAASLAVTNIQNVYKDADWVTTADAKFDNLGVSHYPFYIALTLSSSLVDEKYCPHFASKRDMLEFLNRETDEGRSFTTVLDGVACDVDTLTKYKSLATGSVFIAQTLNPRYENLGESGYRWWLPIYISGSVLPEKLCPHFVEQRDVLEYVSRRVDTKTAFTQSLGG